MGQNDKQKCTDGALLFPRARLLGEDGIVPRGGMSCHSSDGSEPSAVGRGGQGAPYGVAKKIAKFTI